MGRRRVIVAYRTQPIGNAASPAVLMVFDKPSERWR